MRRTLLTTTLRRQPGSGYGVGLGRGTQVPAVPPSGNTLADLVFLERVTMGTRASEALRGSGLTGEWTLSRGTKRHRNNLG